MKGVEFHPEAEQEFEQASDYYDERRLGLGADFEAELKSCLERVALMPKSFPPHGSEGARKCLLVRFPYTVYFLEFDDRVWIVAVAHQKRRPDYWMSRTSN